MNFNLIETREDALALVEADLITIRDYVTVCAFKGWSLTGETVASARTSVHQPYDTEDARVA